MSPDAAAGQVAGPSIKEQVEILLAGPRPLPVLAAGHRVLRAVAVPYDGQLDDTRLAELLAAMRQTMRQAPGVGVAAPQIGLGLAIAVIEDSWPVADDVAALRERSPVPYRVLVNPRYEPVGAQRVAFYEGCLSVGGWQAVTLRWRTVRLTGCDERGRAVDEVLTGWPARIVQHETDHLAGRLYIDDAELRSLVAPGSVCGYPADPSPERAALELGFDLP